MAAVMVNLGIAIDILKNRFPGQHIKCIETGTIRSYNEHHGSTLVISKALGNRGSLISIDYEPTSIAISKDTCKNVKNVTWILSDSVKYLKANQDKFHFAFLDSQNDPDFIFEELRWIWPKVIAGGIIIVDDAGVDAKGKIVEGLQKKGHKIAAFLTTKGCTDFVRTAPYHGTQLWIDTKKVPNGISLTQVKDYENGK